MKILKSLLLIPAIFAITTAVQAQAVPSDVTIEVNGQTGQLGPYDVGHKARLIFGCFNYTNPSIYKACCSVCSKSGKKCVYEAHVGANGQKGRRVGCYEISGTTPCTHTFYISTAGNGLKDGDAFTLDGNGTFGFHNCGHKDANAGAGENEIAVSCVLSRVLPLGKSK